MQFLLILNRLYSRFPSLHVQVVTGTGTLYFWCPVRNDAQQAQQSASWAKQTADCLCDGLLPSEHDANSNVNPSPRACGRRVSVT